MSICQYCGSCKAWYIGKTSRHMKVRVSEHQGVSPPTGKHLKGTFSTSVRDHMLDCNHIVAWNDFKVLGRESNHWLMEINESLLKKIGIRSTRIFTPRNCFYFSFTMPVIKLWWLLFVAIGYVVCKFSRLLINSCKQFKISIDVYLIMEAMTSESS